MVFHAFCLLPLKRGSKVYKQQQAEKRNKSEEAKRKTAVKIRGLGGEASWAFRSKVFDPLGRLAAPCRRSDMQEAV
jgi:hypothetical protein